jgi:hypothetical protein
MEDECMEKVKIAASVLSRVQNIARQYIVAIAGMKSWKEGKVEGTGVILDLGGEVLLVTAEHVVSQIEQKGYQGLAFSNGDTKPYTKVLVPFMRDRLIDISYAKITRPKQPDSDRLACPENLIATSSREGEKDLLFIYGFPGKDSEFWTLLGGIRSKTTTYAAYASDSDWPHFDRAVHIAMYYSPKGCVGIDGKSEDLHTPDGLSGSPLWNIPRNEQMGTWMPEYARIVGIVQRWDQVGRCLIATRIEQILPFLRGETARVVNVNG